MEKKKENQKPAREKKIYCTITSYFDERSFKIEQYPDGRKWLSKDERIGFPYEEAFNMVLEHLVKKHNYTRNEDNTYCFLRLDEPNIDFSKQATDEPDWWLPKPPKSFDEPRVLFFKFGDYYHTTEGLDMTRKPVTYAIEEFQSKGDYILSLDEKYLNMLKKVAKLSEEMLFEYKMFAESPDPFSKELSEIGLASKAHEIRMLLKSIREGRVR